MIAHAKPETCLAVGLACCAVLASCSQPLESVVKEVAPPAEPVAPAPVAEAGPDWDAVYAEAREEALGTWKEPPVGERFRIELAGGTAKDGLLQQVTPDGVMMAFENAEIEYPRSRLSERSRARLYRDDYAHLVAAALVRKAQARHQAQLDEEARLERMARMAESAVEMEPTAPVARADSGPPRNDPTDHSVWQVEDYLQRTLKDPDSIQIQSWSDVMFADDQYRVVCSYSANAGSFGRVNEKKVFFLDESGRVITVSAVRPDPQALR